MTPWKLLVAAVSGEGIEAELMARIEYLETEVRVLKEQLGSRKLRLTDAVRIELAEKALAMKRSVMELTVSIVTPATILRWHRELITRKWSTSDKPKKPGRPPKPPEVEQLVEQFARENRSWGYDRIMDAVKNLGYEISDQTVGNILKRLGLRPSPERRKGLSWREFLARHADVMWATDFFTAEVYKGCQLRTIYVLFFINLKSRQVVIGGTSEHPDEKWMTQVARNLTWDGGELEHAEYLIHDRDSKYSEAFCGIFTGKTPTCRTIKLPPKSPNLNAYAERFVRTIKDECLNELILGSERQLRHVLKEFAAHYHHERNHQGRNHEILVPDERLNGEGQIVRHQRLGGLLNFYHREEAA